MNAKKNTIAAGFAILMIIPAFAAASTPVVTDLTEGDEAKVDALVSPVLSGLIAKSYKTQVMAFFNSNPRMRSKGEELAYFLSSIDGSMAAYGPISQCNLAEKASYGGLAQRRLYICQHDNYLTRWVFDVIKTTSGWMSGNLRYDDKFTLDASQ